MPKKKQELDNWPQAWNDISKDLKKPLLSQAINQNANILNY